MCHQFHRERNSSLDAILKEIQDSRKATIMSEFINDLRDKPQPLEMSLSKSCILTKISIIVDEVFKVKLESVIVNHRAFRSDLVLFG